eukprot:COSAG01_NODE_7919_length_2992_cov_4.821984_3_plen_286_part_00
MTGVCSCALELAASVLTSTNVWWRADAIVVFIAGLVFVNIALTSMPWLHSLKSASVLVADAVAELKQTIQRHSPTSREWESVVVADALALCEETVPLLSSGWGDAVAWCFIAWWLGALAWLAILLEGGTFVAAICMALCSVIPLGMTYDAAAASTDCDTLKDSLNQKRMRGPKNDLEHEHAVRIVELMLRNQNVEQGLGFVVWGRVVDLRTFGNIIAGLVGIGSTVLPILFTLQQSAIMPADSESNDASCELSEAQKVALQSTAQLINANCTFNISVGPSGVIIY